MLFPADFHQIPWSNGGRVRKEKYSLSDIKQKEWSVALGNIQESHLTFPKSYPHKDKNPSQWRAKSKPQLCYPKVNPTNHALKRNNRNKFWLLVRGDWNYFRIKIQKNDSNGELLRGTKLFPSKFSKDRSEILLPYKEKTRNLRKLHAPYVWICSISRHINCLSLSEQRRNNPTLSVSLSLSTKQKRICRKRWTLETEKSDSI